MLEFNDFKTICITDELFAQVCYTYDIKLIKSCDLVNITCDNVYNIKKKLYKIRADLVQKIVDLKSSYLPKDIIEKQKNILERKIQRIGNCEKYLSELIDSGILEQWRTSNYTIDKNCFGKCCVFNSNLDPEICCHKVQHIETGDVAILGFSDIKKILGDDLLIQHFIKQNVETVAI